MTDKLTLRPPSGFVEYSPQEQQAFDKLSACIESVYCQYGFQATQTPAVENLSNLLAKGGCEQEIFTLGRYLKDVEGDMGLRFDLTVPFARYVAAYQTQMNFPFKRYQIAPVWRGERPQSGRYRQFTQCDIDIVAPERLSEYYDPYIISVLFYALNAIEVNDVIIEINYKQILDHLAMIFDLDDARREEFFQLLDKKEKLSQDIFEESLTKLIGQQHCEKLITLLLKSSDADFETSFDLLQQFCQSYARPLDSQLQLAVTQCYQSLIALEIPPACFTLSLTIARGLNYYTGIIFETRWKRFPKLGSIASGGRYDNLVSAFSKKRAYRGIGLSIGLSRLFSAYKETLLKQEQEKPQKEGLLIIVPKEHLPQVEYYYALMRRLRNLPSLSDRRLDIYLQGKKINDQIKYAHQRQFHYVLKIEGEVPPLLKGHTTTELFQNFSDVKFELQDLQEAQSSLFTLPKLMSFFS